MKILGVLALSLICSSAYSSEPCNAFRPQVLPFGFVSFNGLGMQRESWVCNVAFKFSDSEGVGLSPIHWHFSFQSIAYNGRVLDDRYIEYLKEDSNFFCSFIGYICYNGRRAKVNPCATQGTLELSLTRGEEQQSETVHFDFPHLACPTVDTLFPYVLKSVFLS